MTRRTKRQFLNVAFVPENRWLGLRIYTGHFYEIMLTRDTDDLDTFMEMYDVATISKEY